MIKTTTVTQKGQITLPKAMREKVGIDIYDTVRVLVGKKYLRIEPVQDILDLAGKYVPVKNKGMSALKAREMMEKHYTRI
ncbi:AbrB/MazE/SpoVT family DNA-binding domain-containing protein [Patescibacteria group bacterium]|nr:AbrB/MazE/SpoVT family DNA-binding domain-containing protein [Patescibacteria group bacterium]